MKRIKIVWIVQYGSGTNNNEKTNEKTIEDLVNQGWKVVAAGGGTGGGADDRAGFIVLQLD